MTGKHFLDVTLYNKEGLPTTPFRHLAVDLEALQSGRQK